MAIMQKTKIGIIGAGTSGAISLLVILENLINNTLMDQFEIHLFFDSNKPKLKVGEGLSVLTTKLLQNVLGYFHNELNPQFNETKRYGAYCHWKEGTGEDFTVHYGTFALHVDASLFSEWVIEKCQKKFNNVFVVDTDILELKSNYNYAIASSLEKKYELDFILDCRGSPSLEELNSGNYFKPEFESVNSVLIYPQFQKIEEKYTQVYLHDNGWMFGIPVSHRKAFGYIYNNNIISEKTAIEKFCALKNIEVNDIKVNIKWNQYYRILAMEKRIVYVGNKLYFFEPHQAIPLHYYQVLVNNFMILLIKTKNINETELYLNSLHKRYIEHIKANIAINYAGQMNIDSEFWNLSNKKSREYLLTNDFFVSWCKKVIKTGKYHKFGFMEDRIMEQYILGYKIDLEFFDKIKFS